MKCTEIYDPRIPLMKVRRKELERFAEAQGITELTEHPNWPNLPADDMRKVLMARGIGEIPGVPRRELGFHQPGTAPPPNGVPSAPATIPSPEPTQESPRRPLAEFHRLRKLAKERGIKVSRRDNMQTLRAKLGEDAA